MHSSRGWCQADTRDRGSKGGRVSNSKQSCLSCLEHPSPKESVLPTPPGSRNDKAGGRLLLRRGRCRKWVEPSVFSMPFQALVSPLAQLFQEHRAGAGGVF